MKRDQDRQKLFTRRAAMLGGGKVLLLSALVGRMYYLQVVEADRYTTLAEDNRINLRLLAPPRGRIVDRFGQLLAVNRQNYRVDLISEQVNKKYGNVEMVLDLLSDIIEISAGERKRILREIRRKRSFLPVKVRENLTWEEVARIEVNAPNLPGVKVEIGQRRFYPHPDDTGHILGYVAAVSEKDMTDDPLLELPGFRIGKAGIEKVYDLALRGSGGNSRVEVNAFGRVIREIDRNDGQPGAELALTVDLKLQKYVGNRLGSESASAVVMDVRSGGILAMTSTPGYNPNAFNQGLSVSAWKALINNPHSPLINKSVAGQYPPGSTFKMMVALAALEKGVITPRTRHFCRGFIELGDSKFHCWKRGGHGAMNLKAAIKQSCDVYFYEIARRTGIDRISAMAERFGLGNALGVDLPGELSGLMPTKTWKQAAIGAPWQVGETLHAGIGQGYLLVTPLQLAVMTARLVNGGFKVLPHLARDIVVPEGVKPRGRQEPESIGVSQNHLKLIKDAMSSVMNEAGGTAYKARIKEKGFEMGGKTGTAQVRRITKSEREAGVKKNRDLEWLQRDHAIFVGFAPVDNPRYAVSVIVEHGGGGSSTAAPIARDILLKTQRRDIVVPEKAQEASVLSTRREGIA